MLYKLLFILFATLFALQSTSAVMDEYLPHNSNENPFAFDHGHDSAENLQQQIEATDDHSSSYQFDAHHCCHCHASSQFFANVVSNFLLITHIKKIFEYNFNALSISLSPNYRPPRV